MDTRRETKPARILLATDGSEHAIAAAWMVNDLCLPPGSSILVLGVLTPRDASGHALLEAALERTRAALAADGLEIQIELAAGYPAEKIIETAEESRADLVVMGAKGLRHTLGIFLGGVAQNVVEYGTTPTLVVRAPHNNLRNILAVTDGSSDSRRMLEFLSGSAPGAPFFLPPGSHLKIAHVLAPGLLVDPAAATMGFAGSINLSYEQLEEIDEEEKKRGRNVLDPAQELFQAAGIKSSTVLLKGDAATEIIAYAQKNQVDLIATGSRGLSQMQRWLMGSVSRKLLHYAGCSVLVVK
jgi:nucleotide-binding universal stress UspA family protein